MKDESISAGLTSDQLARLWSIGADGDQEHDAADADQTRRDLLLDHLARSLPPDQALLELLPEMLGRLSQQLRLFSGESLHALLADPRVDVWVLERIKDHAKELGTAAQNEMEREVALALYFAAIAAALLHHRAKISQHPEPQLEESFRTLSRRPWIPADLRQLFTAAAARSSKQP
ncbi:MAG: hypothetical protein MUC88_19465 [Planctomycetes bacterium]|jgi:hypothetical protein|nr:hypothetical protein [Planctomycetota bacterium]